MSGPGINLNAGGSPGSATPYGGLAALLPGELAPKPENPAPILTPAQIATMKSAAPFCEECENVWVAYVRFKSATDAGLKLVCSA
ncbi:hypothetical protein P4S72_10860 [Vibrio sp. PP-XX7]